MSGRRRFTFFGAGGALGAGLVIMPKVSRDEGGVEKKARRFSPGAVDVNRAYGAGARGTGRDLSVTGATWDGVFPAASALPAINPDT